MGGGICSGFEKVVIGSNVFIGINSTILKGSTIGDNVIIGAHSVVSGMIEGNSVYAGNPAKKIMSLDEFYLRRKKVQEKNAIDFVCEYKARWNITPNEDELKEFCMLWLNRSEPLPENVEYFFEMTGYGEKCKEYFYATESVYNGVEDLIESALKHGNMKAKMHE